MKTLAVYLLWSGAGWFLLGLGLYLKRYWRGRNERERAYADGTIEDYDVQRHTSKGGAYYIHYPIVRFMAAGHEVSARCDVGLARDKYPVGSAVEVRYDPNEPDHCHLETGSGTDGAGRPVIVIGLIWILVATAAVVVLDEMSYGEISRFLGESGIRRFIGYLRYRLRLY